ncbi:MAG: hypothetical protein KDD15_33135, partial [Lewinella sp.]|nr:hypothetical protein [Lewinella sp.]
DVSGYFILDTGTPYLVLNNHYFKGQPTGKKVIGLIGQEVDIYKKEVDLSMGNLKWFRVEATLLPLNHLSQAKGVTIMGLIGASVLKTYELVIDLDNRKLELVKANKASVAERYGETPDAAFKFIWRGGIPVIKTMVGDETLLFGFDTGAGVNAIDKKKSEQLADHLTINGEARVVGIGQGNQSMPSGSIHNVIIENYYCPEMRVVLAQMARFRGFDNELNIVDGFFGYEFLKHFRTVVNFKKGTISLYHRDSLATAYIVAR